ncbi:MAG TPA: hypothetical protein V6D23_19435, partial [Candidatus Obscuribacterales bacterium]
LWLVLLCGLVLRLPVEAATKPAQQKSLLAFNGKLVFSPDGKYLAIGDRGVILWNIRNRKEAGRFNPQFSCSEFDFFSGRPEIVLGCTNGFMPLFLQNWNYESGKFLSGPYWLAFPQPSEMGPPAEYFPNPFFSEYSRLRYSPNGESLLTNWGYDLKEFRPDIHVLKKEFSLPEGLNDFALDKHNRVITLSVDAIRWWNLKNYELEDMLPRSRKTQFHPGLRLAVSADGNLAGELQKTSKWLQVWELSSRRVLWREDHVESFDLSPDGRHVVLSYEQEKNRIETGPDSTELTRVVCFELPFGKKKWELELKNLPRAPFIRFSPIDQLVALGVPKDVLLLETATGKLVGRFSKQVANFKWTHS